jgi:hypothetical protein
LPQCLKSRRRFGGSSVDLLHYSLPIPPWEGPNRPQTDLLGFEDFEDNKLNLLATFLSRDSVSPEEALADSDDANLFAFSSSSDDEWDAGNRSPYPTPKIMAHSLKAPVDTFNLEDASEDARVLFT